MKKVHVLAVVLLGASILNASTPTNLSNDSIDWNKVEKHYVANLSSDNSGVISSAANFIRKYRLSGAVDDLIPLLTGTNAENVKMSAALALIKVGGDEGRTAVEAALEKEENEIVVEFYRSILQSALTAQQ